MPEDVKPVKQPVKEEAPAPAAEAAKPAAAGAAPKKKDNTLKIVLIVVGVLVGLGIIGTILATVFFASLFNKATDGVDVNDGTVTIQSDDGKVTTSAGEGAKLADGWPSDVPIFEPSTLRSSSTSENTSFSAVASTASSVTDVSAYYKAQMAAQGWATQLDSSSAEGTLLSFSKDNRTSSVIVTTSDDNSSSEKTGFVISISTQQ
jgi:ABC-type lipoprotein release transport system permease subunit